MRPKFIFPIIIASLVSCSTQESSSIHKYEYSDVEDKKISYLDVFMQPEESYYIYYYQESCYHCHGIKSKVIWFALNNTKAFYFVEVDKDYGFLSRTKEDTIGSNDPMTAFALMTPQLSLVESHYIVQTYIGNDEILNIIE